MGILVVVWLSKFDFGLSLLKESVTWNNFKNFGSLFFDVRKEKRGV